MSTLAETTLIMKAAFVRLRAAGGRREARALITKC